MPALSDHQSSQFIKLMFIGHSGSGKTGALLSLVQAGYKLRILDFDNNVDVLKTLSDDQGIDISNVSYMPFRDKMKASSAGPVVDGKPKAFANALSALDEWEDETTPSEWGAETVCVIDSLTTVGRAAFQWAKALNPTAKDPRQWYHAAQQQVEDLIANLTSEAFGTNVIVISHIEIGETADNMVKHFPSAIGKALGPKLPRFFNTLLLCQSKIKDKVPVRTIHTVPTSMLDLKIPAPTRVQNSYPMESGLASIFDVLRSTS